MSIEGIFRDTTVELRDRTNIMELSLPLYIFVNALTSLGIKKNSYMKSL